MMEGDVVQDVPAGCGTNPVVTSYRRKETLHLGARMAELAYRSLEEPQS